MPAARPRQQVGRCGGDQDQVRGLAETNVRHLRDVGPDVGGHRLARQRRPRGLANEAERVRGRDDAHPVAGLRQETEQLTGFVRGDSRADAEDDARHEGSA